MRLKRRRGAGQRAAHRDQTQQPGSLVAALAAAMAYAAVSKAPTSSPARQVDEESEHWGAQSDPPPETTLVIVQPRAAPVHMAGRSQLSLTDDPARIVREVQRELKRVGCYSQEIDGEWGPATRRAMKDLTDRQNAVLPLDRPDPVLLALLQSQTNVVCGDTCPAGEELTKDNRCLPIALARMSPPPMAAQSSSRGTNSEVSGTERHATTASVAPVRRVPQRSNYFGFGIFGLLVW